MDQFEFIIMIFRSLSLLFITIGSIILLISFFEVQDFKLAFFEIKSLKLSSEREKNFARSIGVVFFLLGCLIGAFPTTVNVQGVVMDDSIPANGALVTLNGITKKVCEGGSFAFSNIPKNTSEIEYSFKGITHKAPLDIPIYWAVLDFNGSYNFKFPSLTIEGNVTDDFGKKIPSIQITIWPMDAKEPFSNNSDNNGLYRFMSIPCENPIKISAFRKEGNSPPIKLLEKTVYFTDNDINLGYKRIDICTKRSIDVSGTVRRYSGGINENPTPIIGAIISMGGRLNYTNHNGEYMLKNVPIDAINYSLRMISGIQKNGTIIPPFIYESEKDEIKTTRDIYISY